MFKGSENDPYGYISNASKVLIGWRIPGDEEILRKVNSFSNPGNKGKSVMPGLLRTDSVVKYRS